MDLGTAHGKVKVDADTKGVGGAEKDLKKLDLAFKIVGKAAEAFEKGLNHMERELKQASRDMESADRSADGLGKSIDSANRSTLSWSEGLSGLHSRLKGVNATAADLAPSLLQVAKTALEFKKTQGGVVGFAQALTKVGAIGTVLDIVKGKFFGVGAAMALMPAWSQSVVKFSNSFRLLTFGVGVLTAFTAKTEIFGKVWARVFSAVANRSEGAGIALDHFAQKMKPVGNIIRRSARAIGDLNQQIDKIPAGAVQALTGFALMTNGIRNLSARFAFLRNLAPMVKAALVGIFTSLPGVIQLGAAALRGFSNALALVLDGAKQLGGGFLAIPGAITMMVTAISTLKVLFKSLGTAFEDVFKAKTVEEMAAAIDALPEHLKPIGKVLGEILPKWKEISVDMQKTFVIGAENQLKALSDTYLPAVKQGVLPLVNAFRQVKDELVGFLAQGESISFVKQAFQNTAQTVLNLKGALVPLLSGLRDIASVGMTFIRDMSGGAEGLTKRFQEWAKTNRENGNLMKWMKDAVQGVKDLWAGLKDAGKALWTLLTLFQTDTGDNAIARFADAMKKFNDAVQKSAAGGVLKQIGDAVKQMGTNKLEQLWEIIKQIGDALTSVIPFVLDLSKAFSETFVPALELAIEIIQQIIDFLNQIGAGGFIGHVMGLVMAWKTLAFVLGPIRNTIQTVIGAFNLFKGTEKLVSGVAGALEKFGPAGQKAADKIRGLGDKLKGIFGGIGIAAAAGLAFKEFYDEGAAQIDNMKAKVKELDDFTKNMGHEIATNIVDQGTLQNSKEVFASTIDEMMSKMQEAADSAPGIAGNIADSFRAAMSAQKETQGVPLGGLGTGATGDEHTAEFNAGKKAAENAKLAKDAIDALNMSTDQLNDKVTGTAEGFNQFISSLEASGEGGRAAAENFKKLRAEWEALQAAGEGGVKIASGIDKIASSAGDATSKLEGLKTALEGAGLLKTTQLDAAFAYAESIREIGNAAKTSADNTQPFNDILDASGRSYNTASVNANNLHNDLAKLEGDYMRAVANGGDARQEWDKQGPALQQLADQYHLPIEKVKELAAAEGGLPDAISLLLTVEGADEVKQDVVAALLGAQSAAKDKPVTIPIEGDVAQAKQAIEALLGPGSVIAQTDGTITIKANVDKGAIANAMAVLANAGIKVPGGPDPTPAVVPIQVKVEDRKGVKNEVLSAIPKPEDVTQGVKVEAGPAGPPAPKVAVSPGDQATLDQAKTTIDDINRKTDELNQKKIEIKVNADAINNLTKSVDQIYQSLAEKELKLSVKLEGMEAFQQGMDQIKVGISTSVAQWNNYKIAVVTVFRDIVSAFGTAMADLTNKMNQAGAQNVTAGKKFGDDFAQGIRNSIPEIQAAADAAAAAAGDRMPHSPAKKGPLSGKGWSGYAGEAFSRDFAEGIQRQTSAAADASAGLAEAASASMAGRAESFQGFLGGLTRVLDIISSAIGVVQETFGHVQEMFKIATDLMKPPDQREGAEGGGGKKKRGEGAAAALPGAEGLQGVTDPSKEQIAAAIIGEAQKRGYGRDIAIGAIATGMLESGLNAVIENATGHKGIFQMDKAKPGRDTAFGQINWFFDQLDQLGAKKATDPLGLIASQIEKGGYGGAAIGQFTDEAAAFYDKLITSLDANTSATNSGTKRADQALLANVPVGKYTQTGAADLTKGLADCSSAVEDLVNIADRRPTGGRQMSTANAAEWLTSRGFQKGAGGPGDFRVAFNVNHMQATLPGGTNFNWGSQEAAARGGRGGTGAADPALTEKYYRSALSGDQASQYADEVSSTDLSVYDSQTEQATYDGTKVTEAADNDIIKQLRTNDDSIDNAIKIGEDSNSTDEQQLQALEILDQRIKTQGGENGDQNRQQVEALTGVKSSIESQRIAAAGGQPADVVQQASDAMGKVMDIAGGAMSIAQDIIGLFKTGIETIGMVKQSMDILVRGIENTEQINVFIDTIQKFIEMAAKVAQTVSDITGMISGFTGGADFGATAAVSAITGMISGILTTINAAIDVAQEAWHIFGSYFGQFLGFLVGQGDQLEGDVKFLLDENDKTLKTYSRNNPQTKAAHPMAGEFLGGREGLVGPQIGSITVFGGPNQDPRETTRNMMFAVKSAAMGSTYAQ